MNRTFNWKVFLIVIVLILISLSYDSYSSSLLEIIKNVLDNSFFFYAITCIAFVISIVHKYRNGIELNTFENTSKTKEIIAGIISSLTEPSVLVCSLSIIKGLFLDFFFDDTFFVKFDVSQKGFMLIVSISFFIHSVIEMVRFGKDMLFKVEPIEIK